MICFLARWFCSPKNIPLQEKYERLEPRLGVARVDLNKANNEIERLKSAAEMHAEELIERDEMIRQQAARIEELEQDRRGRPA